MSELTSPNVVGLKMARATGVIVVASILGYVVSFTKVAIVAAYLGTGWQMDIFLWSFALVSMFATVCSGPLNAAFVPVYLSLKAKDARLARDLFEAMLGLLFLTFLGLSWILAAITPMAARVLIGKVEPEGVALATHLVWLMVPMVLFSGLWAACQALLNAEKSFFLPSLSSFLPALVVILILGISGRGLAVYAQAVGLSLGALAQWAILMILVHKKSLGRRFTLNLRVEGIRQVLKLMWPLVATQLLILCVPIVDRTMAARFSSGTISALGYAQSLMNMSVIVFLTAIHTAIFPFLSQQVAEDGLVAFRKTFIATIRILMLFLIPLGVMLIVLREPVIQLVFEREAFDSEATRLTAPAFAAYLMGLVPMAITLVCSRGFNALQDSKTNALVGVIFYVAVKLMMNVALTRVWGYLGLAIATSVAFTATAATMMWVMRRRLGGIEGIRLFRTVGKVMSASAIAGLLAWWGTWVGQNNPLVQLTLGGTFGILGFWLAAYCLKLEDVLRLSGLIVKFSWSRGLRRTTKR